MSESIFSLSQWTLKKKSLYLIFPTKYVIPKSLKFGHWLSLFSLFEAVIKCWVPFFVYSFFPPYYANDHELKFKVFLPIEHLFQEKSYRIAINSVRCRILKHPNSKQPVFYGCFKGMIPNHYIKNCCFTKHPFKTGCLEFQVCIYIYLYMSKTESFWGGYPLSPLYNNFEKTP